MFFVQILVKKSFSMLLQVKHHSMQNWKFFLNEPLRNELDKNKIPIAGYLSQSLETGKQLMLCVCSN